MSYIKTNCHTHTNYCDGKNTAREMIEAAIGKGFTTIGFSGHIPMNFENSWAMTDESLDLYYEELNSLKKAYADKIEVLCGIELDSDYETKKEYHYDYVLSSVHQIHGDRVYFIDYTAEELTEAVNEVYDGDWNKMAAEYFRTLAELVVREKTDVVGHFDLITKFNKNGCLFDENDPDYQKSALEAVDYILDNKPDVVFEVNTGAMFRCGNESPYPAAFILKRIGERGGRVTVSSDAHCTDALDFMFGKAREYCKDNGIKTLWHLTGKGFVEENL
ncbi:MAG: histidinol-phosphatase [Clostridia bacterium]|nr:histidinol-phosphatase [Clostridia bacterium]